LPGFRGTVSDGGKSGVWVQLQGHPCLSPRGKFDGGEEDSAERHGAERSGAMGQSTNAFAELSEVGPAFERRPWTNSLSGRNNEKYCKTSAWRNRSSKS
jgi:hypothetical protein